MASVFDLPTKDISPVATSYRRQNTLISRLMAGYLNLMLTEMNSAGEPKVRAGSVFEVNSSMFFVPVGADEAISGSPSVGQNYIYATATSNGATFKYSAVKPAWSATKGGWYNGNDRAVAKFVYSGREYTQKKILRKMRAGEATSVQNPGDVVEFYQGGVMRAQLQMVLAGLVMSGMLTACDGVMSKGDVKAVAIDPEGWQRITLPSTTQWNKWNCIAYGDRKFVAVDSNGTRGAYSTDGIKWTSIVMPGYFSGITYRGGKFVAVGSSGGAYSPDGINWTSMDMPDVGSYWDVTYGDEKFVAVGSSGGAYSPDGIDWTSMDMPGVGSYLNVAYGGEKFVAYGGGSRAYSTDGINWTSIAAMPSGNWRIAYGDGKFVAVDRQQDTYAKTTPLVYSPDGINWTNRELSGYFSGIAYGGGKFVAVGSAGGAYSPDGINWTSMDMPGVGSYWVNIVCANERFLAIESVASSSTDLAAYLDFFTVKLVFNADGTVGWVKA